ncbi:MAG TPA: monofunctional biosynthetic peptidoglycan transglycosylase [Burkholderiales bacterium]|nr:monofunctional biosynthetic peptidoglycan transglycosylase [Burkholderiales bacterium]
MLAILFVMYELSVLVRLWWWTDHNPSSSAFMEARFESLQEKRGTKVRLKHEWVQYHKISPHLKRALIAAEDSRFLDHEGFDWDGIERAMEKNLKEGEIVAGGSTISQQLAKNLFLSARRTPWRKAQEALITVMMEKLMSKRRILEIYMNVIEWGDNVFGAEAAARHYFNVSAQNLSDAQAARLAAMVPKPRFYDRNRNTSWLLRKTQIILARMPLVAVP